MTAKEYLGQVQLLDKRVKVLTERMEETETALTSISMDLSKERVQGGRGVDNLALLEKLDELTEEQTELRLQLLVKRTRISNQINGLSKYIYVYILTERYLKGRRLDEIAGDEELLQYKPRRDKDPYSGTHIYRLHGLALKEFAEMYAPFYDNVI